MLSSAEGRGRNPPSQQKESRIESQQLRGKGLWGEEGLRTFDQLAAVRRAAVELQGHDMALSLVEELDGDTDRRGHVCGR